MAKRADFGSDWSEFVETWCLGIAPSMPSDLGWEALGVLERLWPEYLDSALVSGKGVWTMAVGGPRPSRTARRCCVPAVI